MSDEAQTEAKVRASILLVEDDDTLAGLLARVLRTEGYSVDLLDRADALPGAAKLARYDVVLSDIHLAEGTSGHDVLREVRKAKSEARRKMRAPVARVVVRDSAERLRALELGSGDLLQAGTIEALDLAEAEEFAVEVELAEASD